MTPSPEQLQHDFYTANAASYHAEYVRADDEHHRALSLISALIEGFRYESVLDVGSGTGRGVKYLADQHPSLEVRGVEPVQAMIDYGERVVGVPQGSVLCCRGEALPFPDRSFDAVCEFGMLHHVARPETIIGEMMRVARRAVFLSDGNRFAQGSTVWRALKYVLYRIGLWDAVYKAGTRGRGYVLTADGGVAYSYSVYESLSDLGNWSEQIFLVPTVSSRVGWFHPLFGATNILVCALSGR